MFISPIVRHFRGAELLPSASENGLRELGKETGSGFKVVTVLNWGEGSCACTRARVV